MQDRYLFRGKRTDNEEWVTGFPNVCGKVDFIVGKLEEANGEYDALEWWYPVDPATIGQCTGLKDKNDRLIFEGDIVKEFWGLPETPSLCEMIFYNGAFVLNPINEIDSGKCFEFTSDTEIMGNIHDNPELVEM